MPNRPYISPHEIASKILGGRDSAPGLDGTPYEVYHHGLQFVTALMAQALLASCHSDEALEVVLGPAEDLAIWIPQKEGLEMCAMLRPLQLPTCFRRLFGTIIMTQIGPLVEPNLSQQQAAILGGSCGPNIGEVFRHLQGKGLDKPPPPPPCHQK